MSYNTVLFDVHEGVGTLTLNRPQAANSLNKAMAQELMDISIECDENPAIRALVLTGNGKMFSAGGDLKSFYGTGETIGHALKDLTVYLHGAISRFARMDAPVITAVNGMAAGAGMSLAVFGDLIYAARSAAFTMAYTAAGLSPDGSSSYFLPRLIGMRRTQELMLTNRRLSAEEALQWGLINYVTDDATLLGETQSTAAKLATGPTAAFGSVKRLLASTFTEGLETQMEIEAREIVENARGRDGREGIEAFVNKRAPTFTGQRH